MKQIKFTIIYIFALLSLFMIASCEDVLDTKAKDRFAEDIIFENSDQVERLVFAAYNSTESWAFNRNQWWGRRFNIEGASFEAKFNFKDIDQFRMRGVGLTPSGQGLWKEKWKNYWSYVRSCNEFLDKIDESEAMSKDPEGVAVLKAEMQFLRANIYSKLVKLYGGVPIMEHALPLDADFNLARDSYEDCISFIVADLDAAAAVLPLTRPSSEFGRATKLAALAVKSRTLLYAASKVHDSSFALSDDPLYIYTKTTKWEDAAKAAKDIIDLVGERDLIAVESAVDYQNLFLSPNEDILFARPYGAEYYEFGTDANSLPDLTQSPNGYGGWALSSPTHNFALQFNMADGTSTDGATYTAADPNSNREMRYYADLLFNGAQFRGRDVQYYLSDDTSVYPHGDDSSQGLGNKLHSSKTGYNIRKYQDESVEVAGGISPERPYVLYRLAEVYLNYAEAKYNLDDEVAARKFINKVSARALQPAITASGADLHEAIKRERRVELCFEGHNFFDERRWMERDHLGFDIRGLKWTKRVDGTVESEEYTVVTRPYFEKHYYIPIPQSEIEKAPAMRQNYSY